MDIYSVEARKFRRFCLDCLKIAYKVLSKIPHRNIGEEELMTKIEELLASKFGEE